MSAIVTIPSAATPVDQILRRFDRVQLEGFISVAIELLDLADGDNDIEANGDELDGTGGEDDFIDRSAAWGSPGCPISDPGGGDVDDEGEAVNEDGADLVLSAKPRYGVDQSLGPINEQEAAREHRAKELGLERSPSGGWRQRRPS